MSSNVRIALDAMGGDNAPAIVIAGASIARKRYPYLNLSFIGESKKISLKMSKFGIKKATEIHARSTSKNLLIR